MPFGQRCCSKELQWSISLRLLIANARNAPTFHPQSAYSYSIIIAAKGGPDPCLDRLHPNKQKAIKDGGPSQTLGRFAPRCCRGLRLGHQLLSRRGGAPSFVKQVKL